MKIVDIIVEIPKNSNVKYEYDKDLEKMRVDRIINGPFSYPTHYGFIPETLAEDGDCLDALIISDQYFIPGCIVQSKVIGVLMMEDEKGIDHKIVTVVNVDKSYDIINELSDIHSSQIKKIEYFFSHYKDLEKDKWSKIIGWGNINEAIEIVEKSKLKYDFIN